jgi:NAD(P)-dependent dehydrogenase (short-subunit alcohol dehydrogenase family)/CO/xanthine dehydrogenase FAD-binding subunit
LTGDKNEGIDGKVALVTGGSRGIGRAIALALAERGCHVAVVARSPEHLAATVADIERAGGSAEGIVGDVREESDIEAILKQVERSAGRLDILVNNAGGSYGDDFRRGPLLDLKPEDLLGAYRMNVLSAFGFARGAVPLMRRSGGGSIVNISSVVVRTPMPEFGAYSAAKAALTSLTATMALEWAPDIRVNAILAGHVGTERASQSRSDKDIEWLERHIGLGRLGQPNDIAGAVVFLASDLARWVTGSALSVDGGVRALLHAAKRLYSRHRRPIGGRIAGLRMKPVGFGYVAPRTVDEALAALAAAGEDGKALAGGQSLGPLMNLRLAAPSVIIDLNRVAELSGEPRDQGEATWFRALTRQREAELSPLVSPLMREALRSVAHVTIRNRGTIAGSLAHADPAAEMPAVAVALDAEISVASARAKRTVNAGDFFRGHFTTALEPDELITGLSVRKPAPRSGSAWLEFAPRHGDFAIVGVAAVLGLDRQGAIDKARLVYSGVSDVPHRARDAEAALAGARPTDDTLDAAAEVAAGCQPPADLIASAGYRRQLIRTLTTRALRIAARRAEENC